jgi:hypothetical protein
MPVLILRRTSMILDDPDPQSMNAVTIVEEVIERVPKRCEGKKIFMKMAGVTHASQNPI